MCVRYKYDVKIGKIKKHTGKRVTLKIFNVRMFDLNRCMRSKSTVITDRMGCVCDFITPKLQNIKTFIPQYYLRGRNWKKKIWAFETLRRENYRDYVVCAVMGFKRVFLWRLSFKHSVQYTCILRAHLGL